MSSLRSESRISRKKLKKVQSVSLENSKKVPFENTQTFDSINIQIDRAERNVISGRVLNMITGEKKERLFTFCQC